MYIVGSADWKATVAREQSIGTCEQCDTSFRYWLGHCGFGDCVYAYCDFCGKTAILSLWDKRMPNLPNCPGQQEICLRMEPYLQPCACGGNFKKGCAPRYPHCREPLSAELAASYIETNAPGTQKGWRWQKNWSSCYCIAIEDNWVQNNFR